MLNSDKIVFYLLRAFTNLFKLLGLKRIRKIARALGIFTYFLFPLRKKVVIDNLSIAFPDKSKKEISRIALQTYQNAFIVFFELIYFPFSKPEEMIGMLKLDKIDFIRKKISEKKGLIFLGGHFGGWEVLAVSGGLQIAVPIFVLAKKMNNVYLNDWLTKARQAYGNKIIWLGLSVRNIFDLLKNGGVIGVVADQRGPVESPRINFFGKPTAFNIGTASIIAKTKCSVMMGLAVRQKDYSYKAVFEELDLSNLPDDFKEQTLEITQRYASCLEKYIREYPDQYFWLHKLWKY